MRYLEDFRFVIGLFFAVVSLILFWAAWSTASHLNWIAGAYIALVAMFLLGAGYVAQEDEVEAELAE